MAMLNNQRVCIYIYNNMYIHTHYHQIGMFRIFVNQIHNQLSTCQCHKFSHAPSSAVPALPHRPSGE